MNNLKNKDIALLIILPLIYTLIILSIAIYNFNFLWFVKGMLLFGPAYLGLTLFIFWKNKNDHSYDYIIKDNFNFFQMNYKIILIAFNLILIITFLNLHLNFTRDLIYYLLIALLFIVTFIAILNEKTSYKINFLMIVILSSIILSTILFNRTLHFGGTDLLIHYRLIEYIESNFQLFPTSLSSYHYFPNYFYLNAILSSITQVSVYNSVSYLSIFSFSSILILIFSFFRRWGNKFALLLTLIISVDSVMIFNFSDFIPRTLSFYFYLFIMYILFEKYKNNLDFIYKSKLLFILMFFIFSVVLSHQVSNIFIMMVLLIFGFLNHLVINIHNAKYKITLIFFLFFSSYWILVAKDFFSNFLIKWVFQKNEVNVVTLNSLNPDFFYNTFYFIFTNLNYLIYIFFFSLAFFVILHKIEKTKIIVPFLLLSTLFVFLYIPNPIGTFSESFNELYRLNIFLIPFFIYIMTISISFLIKNVKRRSYKKIIVLTIVFIWAFISIFSTLPDKDNPIIIREVNYFNEKDMRQFSFFESYTQDFSNVYSDYQAKRYFEFFPSINDSKIKKYNFELLNNKLDELNLNASYVLFRYTDINRKSIPLDGYVYFDENKYIFGELNNFKFLVYNNKYNNIYR